MFLVSDDVGGRVEEGLAQQECGQRLAGVDADRNAGRCLRSPVAGAAMGRLEEVVRDYTADLRHSASHGRRHRWTWPGLALAVL